MCYMSGTSVWYFETIQTSAASYCLRWMSWIISNLMSKCPIVHEPDHFSVPKGGTNSRDVFCKDHTQQNKYSGT